MKNKKLNFSILAIFILIVCVFILNMPRPQNDIASMEKMISKQIKAKETVVVYNMDVVDDYRLVGYLIEDEQKYEKFGFALFKVNKKDNYEFINAIDADKTTKETTDIIVYEFSQFKLGDFSQPRQLVIISNNSQLASIERITKNGEIQIKEVTDNPSISFFEDLDSNVKVKYNFYDKGGNIIK
ncbi:hypothetical protein [Crassaminicella profunda]|uniref:hypothetical protein n=1 Tax=Crassaminicella profunda TaxID=1286698 RepID=UPI001CA6D50F|nr:hypothetical protein [Crassaminicella profunda]QZY53942.1 hypothetical protein K7H06_12860 [Crassaminicella profunda]